MDTGSGSGAEKERDRVKEGKSIHCSPSVANLSLSSLLQTGQDTVCEISSLLFFIVDQLNIMLKFSISHCKRCVLLSDLPSDLLFFFLSL